MTSDVKTTRSEAQLGGSALCSASKGRALCQASTVLAAHATPLRTRRGQAVALMFEGGETAFIVRAGVLTLQVTMPGTTRQVVAMLFQGDVLRSSFAPPYAEGALVSAGTGEVWRMRWTACAELAAGDPAIALYFDDALANQMARQAIHAAALGRFDCEQRVATFLIELALRTGVSTSGGGIVFDMPFNRTDIADYLGLNPDTLSRIMSRLRTSGLISPSERSRAVVSDLRALAALSPAARSLIEIHGDGQGDPAARKTL
jgi:CRP/FNR family transcriptional regulator